MKLLITTSIVLFHLALSAQTPSDTLIAATPSCTYGLGEVTIVGTRHTDTTSTVGIRDIELYNRMNVAQAVNLLPGVTLAASGARNETMVHVRGFDLRQVPLYLDGIPVYIPYDGYVDLARFATMDLARIDVSKGFTSILYGPNTMGGAINMITRKPVGKLDYNGSLSLINTNGGAGNLNIGTLRKKYFLQGGIAYIQRGDYSLSKDFEPTRNEDGGVREHSAFTDQRFNVKAGFTPNEHTEYTVGFIQQHGEKSAPIYAGIDQMNPLLTKPRYWEWPSWDKQSIYFMSRNRLRKQADELNTRIYFDKFQNAVFSYDDATYSTMSKPYAFKSYYDDQAGGAQVEYITRAVPSNMTKVAATYRFDEHQEHNEGDPIQTYFDRTWSIGLENIVYMGAKWQLIPGLSYNARQNDRADDVVSGEVISHDGAAINDAFNGQVLIQFQPRSDHRLHLSGSSKTRFATIKDRYSYRMGQAVPNPDLGSETAINTEIGYTGSINDRLVVEAALFYSHLNDVIQQVDNVQGSKWQLQNAGEAVFLGGELALNWSASPKVQVGANYSYIQQNNVDNPEIEFIGVPPQKVFGHVDFRPTKWIFLNANAEYNDSRYSTSYGGQTDPFAVFNAKVGFHLKQHITLEATANNIVDANYAITEGYPCEGRNFMLRLLFRSI
ncbi:MAG: TonB-dependent receptor [Flavobacteriales bacterium]|nr:TonB-dependent receptor [Flavobacteriales bacterium]